MRSTRTGTSSTVAGRITASRSRRSGREPGDHAQHDIRPRTGPALASCWWCRCSPTSAGLAALGLPEDLGDLIDEVDQLLAGRRVHVALGAGRAGSLGGPPEEV